MFKASKLFHDSLKILKGGEKWKDVQFNYGRVHEGHVRR
jgi:hypothetical protein